MTVLKALKKIFGKSEAEPLAPASITPSSNARARTDAQQPGRPAHVPAPAPAPVNTPDAQPAAEQPPVEKPKIAKPRRAAAPKPPVIPWKLEDFAVEPQEGKVRFHDFKLAPELMHAIQDLGFPYCTPIQAGVLGYTLGGRDAIGRAQTGTGKTAAFLISIISQLTQTPPPKERYMGEPRALIIAPTRELVVQIAKDAADLTKYTDLNVMTFVGGMDFDKQLKQLEARHCDILVATPGRLLDFNQRGEVHLDMVEVMVLDEADRMLDMGFVNDIRAIVSQVPSRRQTLCFSATMNDGVKAIVDDFMHQPETVSVKVTETNDHIYQDVVAFADDAHRKELLVDMLRTNEFEKVIVFGETKFGVQRLSDKLEKHGIRSRAIHGNKSQGQRNRALKEFKTAEADVLVATDVAARGLDIPDVSHVINYDTPTTYDDYVHRIGRTGRGGKSGTALTFVKK